MKTIDLNVDIGEGFPWDRDLLEIATSANICIGGYAGSRELCLATARIARDRGLAVGAHVGYADPDGFGRRSILEVGTEAADTMESIARDLASDFQPDYIKPHGAFYNETAAGLEMPRLRRMLSLWPVPLLGVPVSAHDPDSRIEPDGEPPMSYRFQREGFADRKYGDDGRLLPRSVTAAVLTDLREICDQAIRLAESVDSICIHGDHDGCVARAEAVRRALEEAQFSVRRMV
jgi:UPF0271 protein